MVDGDAKQVLVAQAQDWGADVTFVGEHGRHGPSRAILGSVAAAVAARASCTDEIVPTPAEVGAQSVREPPPR